MPFKYNPFTGNLDQILAPGKGTAAIEFDGDSGTANPDSDGIITIAGGTGISTTASGSTVTITNDSAAFEWTEVTTTSQSMSVENGYIANNASLVTLTLPATAALGERVKVVGKGAGLFKIGQNAGQTIHFLSTDTTTGTGGSVTAIEQYGTLELICITANTDWVVVESMGNFTVV
ncbi:MAG: hypothetical protein R3230_01350 [Nitrosopumilaceae archaeon]|nr:hypothetical protein [Nitrosopumilaceae archaeon]